jgi:hypothetical protein
MQKAAIMDLKTLQVYNTNKSNPPNYVLFDLSLIFHPYK